ncbi:NAD(P)H-binding protein [Paenibacillus mucilaginosus]|uniref:Oxidoreductase n=1 Tax=Paenibacillus mucilaginosus (strain KNP414) TaxID=1036673 RepID=F8FAB2_PAEMK|nr:NAD(P)H-binding protein [Paenibacillus mucilaginosus]AEI39565.1 Oxidoreductase [Paenibacillus mucilaginosus KNP414]MCG7214622.1 NAD(P)H-binding protein [Paenibacillus mucilaginosus]WDM28517.1 NAD(P)H-binding protein [Paenibacillus mucilaginosus]
MNKTAIVAGATGLIGRELVRQLTQDAAYGRVIALVRSRTDWEGGQPEELVTDWSEAQLEPLLRDKLPGADVYCALGTTIRKAGSKEQFRRVDLEYPLTLGRLARAHGASRLLVVSSTGADSSSRFFYSRVKGEMEEALRALGLPELHFFRPSLLLGQRKNDHRPGEKFAEAVSGAMPFLFRGPLQRYKPIQAAAVARGMIRAALREHGGEQVWESERIAELSR